MPSPRQPHCQNRYLGTDPLPSMACLGANLGPGAVFPTLSSVAAHVHTNLLCKKPRRHALLRLTRGQDVCDQMQASMAGCCHDSGLVVDLSGAADPSRTAKPLFIRDSSFVRGRQRRA